jgi:hypothetical protein
VKGNSQSRRDNTDRVVAAGMLLLAFLGIATVFHEPLRALLAPAGQPAVSEANR